MENNSPKTQKCPNCSNNFQINEGFSMWCEKCNWNLMPQEAEQPKNLFQSIHLSLSRKQGKSLFNSLINAEPKNLHPSMDLSLFVAFLIAIFVHFATILFAFLGIYLLIFGWESLFLIIAAIICILMAIIARPRFAPIPFNVVSKQDFPNLYKFVDSLAEKLQTKSIDAIVINDEFSAAFGEFGWSRKKILYIGLPLWEILNTQEKIALISHELSHGINGDPIRGVFIGTAVETLLRWHNLLYVEELWERGTGIEGIIIIPLNILSLIISLLMWFLAYILISLLYMNSQKAEYLADYLATKVSGTEAIINLLEKVQIGQERFFLILQKFSVQNTKADLFETIRNDFKQIPRKEKDRLKRLGEIEESSLDHTHPPTFFRMEFLKNHFEQDSKITFTENEIELVDTEISKVKSKVQMMAIDNYRATLYY